MRLIEMSLGGYPITDLVLRNIGDAILEQLPEAQVIGRSDKTMVVIYRNRSVEIHRNEERGYEEDGVVRIQNPATNQSIYNGKDPYQALSALIDYFKAARVKWVNGVPPSTTPAT